MDWTGLIGAVIGGGFTLLGSVIVIRSQNKNIKNQLETQKLLFDKQLLAAKNEKDENLKRRKQESAAIFYYLIPNIAIEGFLRRHDPSYFQTSVFADYNLFSALNNIRDELTIDGILYMTLLIGNINAISRSEFGSGLSTTAISSF